MQDSARPTSIYKIDRFIVPPDAVAVFQERLHEIQRKLDGRPGCIQNLVLSGLTLENKSREFVTIVEWASRDDFAAAFAEVRKQYADEDFDPQAFMKQLGVVPVMGVYQLA